MHYNRGNVAVHGEAIARVAQARPGPLAELRRVVIARDDLDHHAVGEAHDLFAHLRYGVVLDAHLVAAVRTRHIDGAVFDAHGVLARLRVRPAPCAWRLHRVGRHGVKRIGAIEAVLRLAHHDGRAICLRDSQTRCHEPHQGGAQQHGDEYEVGASARTVCHGRLLAMSRFAPPLFIFPNW